MSFTDEKISVVATLRNLASGVRNGEVTQEAGAYRLEQALEHWGTLEPEKTRITQAVGSRIVCSMQAGTLTTADAAKEIVGLTNSLVEACAA